jgi:hypothetical protein
MEPESTPKMVYLLSDKGITSITYLSLLKYLKNKYKLETLGECKGLMRNFKYFLFDIGETPIKLAPGNIISVGHGELLTASVPEELYPCRYWLVHPEHYTEIMEVFIEADKEAN